MSLLGRGNREDKRFRFEFWEVLIFEGLVEKREYEKKIEKEWFER